VIHEEKGHCGSGSNGFVANLVRVEPKGGKTPAKQASVAKKFLDEGVADFENLVIAGDRAHGCLVIPIRDGRDDSLCCRTPAEERAKGSMTRLTLGLGIHVFPIFLILEHNGDVMGKCEKVGVGE
jgi:hypothetical protein